MGTSKNGGYTLIELTVVIILIGIVMTLAVPQFKSSVFTDDLKSATRKIVGIIQELRDDAIDNQEIYHLMIDLETNRFWAESQSMSDDDRFIAGKEALKLPDDVQIIDILFRYSDKKMVGQTSIQFNKKGYIQPALIHLGSKDGRRLTIELAPFQGRVKVLDDYLAYEDI